MITHFTLKEPDTNMANDASIKKSFYLKTWHLFLIILIGIWMNTWILQKSIMTREVYRNLLSAQLDAYRIDDYLNFINKLSMLSYIFVPIILWVRLTFVTLLIQFPLIIQFIDISFKKIFRIVTFAQISILTGEILRTLWLLRLKPDQINEERLTLMPLAITAFFDGAFYPKLLFRMLNRFNVFEIVWCLILIKGLTSTGKLKRRDASLVVLIVWTLILVFQWALLLYLKKVNS